MPQVSNTRDPIQLEALQSVWSDLVTGIPLTGRLTEKPESGWKDALYQNLLAGTAKLVNEWQLPPLSEAALSTFRGNGADRNSKLFDAIKEAQEIVTCRNRSGPQPTSFDSWPVRMREADTFNCVGGTLLGMHYLEQLGVEHYLLNPFEHCMNAVCLPGDEWVLIDFTNGVITKPACEFITLSGQDLLRVKEPVVDCEYFPLFEPRVVVSMALGNLSEVQRFSTLQDRAGQHGYSIVPARNYIARYATQMDRVNWNVFICNNYPEVLRLHEINELKAEGERVRRLRSL